MRARLKTNFPQDTKSFISLAQTQNNTKKDFGRLKNAGQWDIKKHTIADMHGLFRLEQIVEGETYKHFQTWWS
jgi:hypothetical protein